MTLKTSRDKTQPQGQFSKSRVLFEEEYENLSHTKISISEEKLRLQLIEYEKSVRYKFSWGAPFGIFLTLITAILTTDFKTFLLLDKATWEVLYWVGALLTLYLTGKNKLKSKNYNVTMDILIDRIKNKP
ncbi:MULTISPECIES: hypothetical protein [Vibrio]|uniref:hypothetical protein n=1 Tax=Vibrio TaxID=662 RepID=UPI000C8590AA|nr:MULTISPECIES: hypothetical protein [Vibrio]MCG9694965.1 hypothetical protein [Vibrio sp. Isolate22]PMJ42990.1 hypothetical protein BCU24_07475 [Vibrio cyclitrophicus]PTO65503.1 hypothetical protein CWN96_12835 [Vibrio splendidus]